MKAWLAIFSLLFILLVILIVSAVQTGIYVDNECKGYYNRTIESADAQQMQFYLDKTIKGMEKLRITDVYADAIFKVPANDLSIDYAIFKNLYIRLDEVKKYPVGSMDYAKSLDDIRIQIKSQTFDPYGGFIVNYAPLIWWLLLNIVALLLWIAFIIGYFVIIVVNIADW
jgi:hypothetical protein